MKVELTPQDCGNIKVALLHLAKSPQINEDGMKVLLVLSEKFVVEEELTKEVKK